MTHVDRLQMQLASFAGNTAARFCAPVYLVGSALDRADTRDVDVRVVLSDEQFEARGYGLPTKWPSQCQRWIDDVAKLSAQVVADTRLNVDFQIQSNSWAEIFYGDKPRLLLASPNAEVLKGT